MSFAASNGFNNDGTGSVVTVNIPPLAGYFAAKAGYAEVIVESRLPRGFSMLWGSEPLTVRARAVALGKWASINSGIIVLDPSEKGALSAGGKGNLEVTGGAGIIVNSSHPSALIANGGGSVSATQIDITGGYSTPGKGRVEGQINLGAEPVPDPLAYLPPPSRNDLPIQSTKDLKFTKGKSVLQPGVYKGGISITSKAVVTLQPGIYYLDGGGLSVTGGGSLIGQEVMIYNDSSSNSDKISVSGNPSATISLTPPSTGIYQGISIFQDRLSTTPIDVSGNGNFNIQGTFYAAKANLKITGNSDGNGIGSQYITYQLQLGGNADLAIDWHEEQSARIREIFLVE